MFREVVLWIVWVILVLGIFGWIAISSVDTPREYGPIINFPYFGDTK